MGALNLKARPPNKQHTAMDKDAQEIPPLLGVVFYLMSFGSREERNEKLETEEKRKALLPPADFERYEELRKKEKHHIKHVRRCHGKLLPGTVNNHDYTKDEFYIMITILAFSFSLKDDFPEGLWQSELDRHFKAEPHHPEYEKLNEAEGLRISDTDVAEMALDRLSRNLQFSGGEYNDETLKKYEPEFVYDSERRLVLYWEKVADFKETVKRFWDEMKE